MEVRTGEVIEKTKEIAEHLEGFRLYKPHEEDPEPRHHPAQRDNEAWLIRDSDGMKLSVDLPYYGWKKSDEDRLQIEHENPRNPQTGTVYHFGSYGEAAQLTRSITVSWNKTPKRIAGDITRRLLPYAEKRQQLAKEGIASDLSYEANRTHAIKEIAKALGVDVRDEWMRHRGQPTMGSYSDIRVKLNSPTSFEIMLDSKKVDEVVWIINLIHENRRPHKDAAPRDITLDSSNTMQTEIGDGSYIEDGKLYMRR